MNPFALSSYKPIETPLFATQEDFLNVQPAVFSDLTNDDYHKHVAISRSGLLLFRKSPLHYYDKYIKKSEDEDHDKKESLVFGNAFHTYVLERDTFADKYAVAPACDRRTKVGKDMYESFLYQHGHKTALSQKTYEKIKLMGASIDNYPMAMDLIKNCKIENSLFWVNKETGVLCKARPDIWHDNMIVDLKTTTDGSPTSFQRQIGDYGYHVQAAMIQEAIFTITHKVISNFIFLAVEKTTPFAVAIYTLDEEAIEFGRKEFVHHLNNYKNCLESNEWPHYAIQQLSIPRWYLNYIS